MAADRAKTSLMIALIIFVMIAFVLAVTTYLGFQQKGVEQLASGKAAADLAAARDELATTQRGFEAVREVLGTDKDTADDIVAERNELFDAKFAAFDKEPKSLLRLVEWLADSVRTKEDDIKRLEAEKAQIRAEQEAAVAQALSQQQAAEKARDEALKQQADQKADFDQRWQQHVQAQGDLKTKQEAALAEAERLRSITEELAKLAPLLSSEARRKFTAVPPEGQPEPWPERVGFVRRELEDDKKMIRNLNATLAQLRVADPKLQKLVRDSTPDDDRIDGFDGRISSVNAADRTVLILCDSTAGMRPGLTLSVYEPDDPRPRSGERKGLVEVIDVEGPTLARARIRSEAPTVPILAGDGVGTSLWSAGTPREVVIVGFVRFGAGRRQDADALKAVVIRNGGRVVDSVSPTTSLVVDGGTPESADGQVGAAADWKPADDAIRRKALTAARESGIRIVSLDALLDMLGVDVESLDGRRLPNAVGATP